MVRTILVVGAGKSTSYLLDYFLKKSNEENIHLKIGDIHPENIPEEFAQHPNCTVFPWIYSTKLKEKGSFRSLYCSFNAAGTSAHQRCS